MDAIPALNHLPLDFDMEETQNSPLIKPLFIFFLSQTESYMTYIYWVIIIWPTDEERELLSG